MADPNVRNALAEAAMARVLAAEREARNSIEQAQADVLDVAESARGAVRRLEERTEQRTRQIVAAFEHDLAARLADIDAEAARFEVPQPIGPEDRAALERAVAELSRQLIGA